MPVYKDKVPTKDGRIWFYKTRYTDIFGNKKQIKSKKFATKGEAKNAEAKFLVEVGSPDINLAGNMTFKELYEKFYENRRNEVKETTIRNYGNKYKHIECFMEVRCADYSLEMFDTWKKSISDNPSISLAYKNDLLKFWKSILNYGMTWYNLDFNKVYRRMTTFKDPNGMKKEMLIFTYDDFKKYIAVEEDLKYRCLWKTLYYCGLRIGEARGLMWECIDFKNKKIKIDKQVQHYERGRNHWYISSPKTRDSNRLIPMCDSLYDDLLEYYNFLKRFKNFRDEFFVFGQNFGIEPFSPDVIRDRHRLNCDSAGLKYIRIHDFRHSCVSLLINSGASPVMVAKYMGHTKIDVTLNTYSHLFESALDHVVGIINNLEVDI